MNLNYILVLFLLIGNSSCNKSTKTKNAGNNTLAKNSEVEYWVTKSDQSALLEKQSLRLQFGSGKNDFPTIEIDSTQSYQSIDGFGYTLTGGSAWLINKFQDSKKTALLEELFSTKENAIGVSYLRISIGASDLDASVFTYNDLPAGETDPELKKFSLEPDKENLIPLLQQILKINPDIKIMGSPWTPPVWMKTNNNSVGGKLKPEYYETYAQYFVKYIQGMAAEGIKIDAITIQNEPLNPKNNPSLEMQAAEQASFIKKNLGPAFKKAGIKTKILLYDHNADRPDYPMDILKDADAAQYVDGSAFHLYGGKIEALSEVHDAFPDKNIYFTEQWVGGPSNFGGDLNWHVQNLIIGATRNWSKNVLEWNLAADPEYKPHTNGGCTSCLGALTISNNAITRNVAYYIIAHASKFVRPGAVRIASNITNDLQNVAFKNTDGKKVLIVLNNDADTQHFNVQFNGKTFTNKLDKGAVATYVWE
jgi:glucosylceramidase